MTSWLFKFRYLATFLNEWILFQQRIASHKQGDSGITLRSIKTKEGELENKGCNDDDDVPEISKVWS